MVFETLKDKKAQRIIDEAFKVLGKKSIILGLKYIVEQGLSASNEEQIQVVVRDERMTITRIRWNEDPHGYVPGRGDPHIPKLKGIPLPDEEAKRAIRRDKTALKRLRLSPAYLAPIKNRVINWFR